VEAEGKSMKITANTQEGLIKELFHGASAPTLGEIINLIPEEKRVLLKTGIKKDKV
jgi:hypothetical protein